MRWHFLDDTKVVIFIGEAGDCKMRAGVDKARVACFHCRQYRMVSPSSIDVESQLWVRTQHRAVYGDVCGGRSCGDGWLIGNIQQLGVAPASVMPMPCGVSDASMQQEQGPVKKSARRLTAGRSLQGV